MIQSISPVGSLFAIALFIWVAAGAASAETDFPGKVVVATLKGKVEAVHPDDKKPRSLKPKDIISEKHTVNVGTASSTTLVFSNGATINLLEDSSLAISEFLQDPFSVPFSMPVATEEPTTSTTRLDLTKGEVVVDVKKLRTEQGSSLTVNTPVGAAGIRGTIFALSYLPNQNGTDRGVFTLSVTEGEVVLTDSAGNLTVVTAGQEIVISFRSAVDPLTGVTTVIEILSKVVRDIPADRLAMIRRVADDGEAEADLIIFDSTEANVLDILAIPDGLPEVVDPDPVTDVDPQSNDIPRSDDDSQSNDDSN